MVSISFPQVICDSNKFKYLTVLKFVGYDFMGKSLPKGIKKLVNLRFLSVKDSDLTYLPSSVGQLKYLQTLDIRVSVVILVPEVRCKLKRLKRLCLSESNEVLPSNSAPGEALLSFLGLSKLETLVGFYNNAGNLKHLSGLNNLRFLNAILAVSKNKDKNDVSENLNSLNSNLHKQREARLTIYYPDEGPVAALADDDVDKAFPSLDFLSCHCLHQLSLAWAKCVFHSVQLPPFPSNLSDSSLSVCSIEGDPMSFLGNLSNLRRLSLRSTVDLLDRKMMITDANAFPKLISLEIIHIQNLGS